MKRSNLARAYTKIPADCYTAMMTAAHSVQEEPIMKKRISAILVFAIITILLAGAAIAAITMQGTGTQILQAEQTEGYYETWPASLKASLITELADMDYLEITPDVERLLGGQITDADEVSRVADEAMAAFTGVDASEISFLIIMQAAWGPFDSWSTERQAWYSDLYAELGLQRDGITRFVLPTGTVDEAQAVALARAAIAKGYGVDENALDGYTLTTSFQVPEFANPGDEKAYWYVGYEKPLDMSKEDALFSGFEVFIDPDTGEFLETVDEIIAFRDELQTYLDSVNSNPLIMDIVAFREANDLKMNPETWSLETFADFSERFHERGLKQLADNPELFSSFLPSVLSHAYSLPDDKAISQADALAIAENAIVTHIGRKADEVIFFTHTMTVMYDITDPEKPLWKFYFKMPSMYNSDTAYAESVEAYYGENGERLPNIKIEIDAYTGEVVKAFTIDFAYDFTSDPNGDGLSDFYIALYMQVF